LREMRDLRRDFTGEEIAEQVQTGRPHERPKRRGNRASQEIVSHPKANNLSQGAELGGDGSIQIVVVEIESGESCQ
jgi:hypothetical protein